MKPAPKKDNSADRRILDAARRALKIEAESVAALIDRLGPDFVQVVHRLDACDGHVVVTGIGKSGLVGQKIAATFSSIGLPCLFLHAAEGSHGDLGLIKRGTLVLAISNSGETEEVLKLLPPINRFKCALVAITGRPDSTLGRRADYVLDVSTREEACQMNLVPTASTTATLAMGDALALALMEKRGFKPEDYALFHPGGSLGRKLLTTVADLMHTGEAVPRVPKSADLLTLLAEMSRKRLGATLVVDGRDSLLGIITDGDLRRLMQSQQDTSKITAGTLMHQKPKTIPKDALASRALQIMEEYSITSLIVSPNGKKIDGMIHLHDLLRAGIA